MLILGTLALCPCCAAVLGIDGEVEGSDAGVDGVSADGSAPAEGGQADTGDASAAADGRPADDAAEAGDAMDSVYSNDITRASLWSTFDVSTAVDAGGNYFIGATFDGRYVYFVPYNNGLVTRYDTQANFATGTSWSTFDMRTVNAGATDFEGAAFDGRYVYFVPSGINGTHNGLVTRLDTQASFTADASWSIFDTTTVNAGAKGFVGAAFDGRYVYFVPSNNGAPDGIVTRYDTQATFAAGTSWSTFDTTTVNAGAGGFVGAVFDGRYVHFVPAYGSPSGIVTRFDTQASFTTSTSWSTFDATTVNPTGSRSFQGAAFDGRYVYFVPSTYKGFFSGLVTRYDTQASFTTDTSWSTFDTTTVNVGAKGFIGGAFDGRYVYFVPNNNNIGIGIDGIVTRYDTQATFAAGTSWSTFDTSAGGPSTSGKGFEGAVFDGRYVYFVPTNNGIVARFDAKMPPSMPTLPGWNGSFL